MIQEISQLKYDKSILKKGEDHYTREISTLRNENFMLKHSNLDARVSLIR